VILAFAILQSASTPNAGLSLGQSRRHLRDDPLDLSALDAVALGDRNAPLLTFAGQRGWRDARVQYALLRSDLASDRAAPALDHADALLRMDADRMLRLALFPVLADAANDQRYRRALAARLAAGPEWRADFLNFATLREPPATTLALLNDLAESPRPPTLDEYRPLVRLLIQRGDPVAAARVEQTLSSRAG